VRLPGIAPGPSTWQEDILLLNHSRESKRAGSFTLPAHAISTKNKHLLVIYSIPTRGFTAAVSVFWGTPPPKPLECKSWRTQLARFFATDGHSPSVENLGSPAPVLVLCRLTSSRCRLRFVHRSFTFRSYTCLRSFRENKKPCLLCGKQGLGKFYGSSVTCLPPGYPNSFRGFVLYTIWIGQG
jgi:hypothetical protein